MSGKGLCMQGISRIIVELKVFHKEEQLKILLLHCANLISSCRKHLVEDLPPKYKVLPAWTMNDKIIYSINALRSTAVCVSDSVQVDHVCLIIVTLMRIRCTEI